MSGFSRFKKGADAAPAAATPSPQPAVPAPAPVVVAPAPAPATPRSLTAATVLTKSVLADIAAEPASDFVETFPHILLKGGNGGGQMVPSSATERAYKEILGQLPQGKQPVQGVFMAARAEAVAWPTDFDTKSEGDHPAISCAISLGDTDGIGLLLQGAENFQFANRDAKSAKWQVKNGGPGYLRPVFQVMVWLPALRMPVVFQASPLLKTFRQMASELQTLANPDTGELAPRPVALAAQTAIWYEDNVFHYWGATAWADAPARAAYDAYQLWIQEVLAGRPDVAQAVTDWFQGTDKAPTDDHIAKLRQAAGMVNPRGRKRGAGDGG